MANRARGEISFRLGQDDYLVRLDINALCDVEDVTGKRISEIGRELLDPSASLLRALLWAGLRAGGHELSIGETGDLMRGLGLDRAGEVVGEAVAAAFPSADKGSRATNPPKAAGGNGTV